MKTTLEDLKKCFKGIIPDDMLAKLDPAQPMVAQGVDSLAVTGMAVALQHTFKVTITVEEGVKMKTLNDVLAFLNKA